MIPVMKPWLGEEEYQRWLAAPDPYAHPRDVPGTPSKRARCMRGANN